MPPESTPAVRDRAARVSGDADTLEGPLKGYHHETYVFPLPAEAGQVPGWRWKFREPRDSLFWFDRRCFRSEEELLVALRGRVTRIPEVGERDGFRLQQFIEGRTLGASVAPHSVLPDVWVEQIIMLFWQLTRIAPNALTAKRRCEKRDHAADGDTKAFLEGLIRFTEERVYLCNEDRFGGLFKEFGIDRQSFDVLRRQARGMKKSRPFCLLHGDLHRENFIVDLHGRLWTIDWELAMVGDPLYDLATHLHLMRYSPQQADEVTDRWCTAVDEARQGSSAGCAEDLDRLLAYKRAQSVFTDVIRIAQSLDSSSGPDDERLERAAHKVGDVLSAASDALALGSVKSHGYIVDALRRWTRPEGAASRR